MQPELSVQWIVKRLSPWTPWKDRERAPGADGKGVCGVYVLAHYSSGPPTKVDPLDEAVVRIGESTAKNAGLGKRLKQFDRTAFRGANSHGPAKRYRKLRSAKEKILYVSTLPVQPYGSGDKDRPASRARAFTKAAERLLLWQYVERNGHLPCANGE